MFHLKVVDVFLENVHFYQCIFTVVQIWTDFLMWNFKSYMYPKVHGVDKMVLICLNFPR